jgi:hypothetical protein
VQKRDLLCLFSQHHEHRVCELEQFADVEEVPAKGCRVREAKRVIRVKKVIRVKRVIRGKRVVRVKRVIGMKSVRVSNTTLHSGGMTSTARTHAACAVVARQGWQMQAHSQGPRHGERSRVVTIIDWRTNRVERPFRILRQPCPHHPDQLCGAVRVCQQNSSACCSRVILSAVTFE